MPAIVGRSRGVEGRGSDAARNAVRNAARQHDTRQVGDDERDSESCAGAAGPPKRDSLRSLRAGAIWSALPARDQHLLLWLLAGGHRDRPAGVAPGLRTSCASPSDGCSRLVEFGLLHGFWTAGAQRPRGRYAYALTRTARLEIERLVWPEGRPERPPDLPSSMPVHQLATHDLLAAFLRVGNPSISEGLVAWVPERACGSAVRRPAATGRPGRYPRR